MHKNRNSTAIQGHTTQAQAGTGLRRNREKGRTGHLILPHPVIQMFLSTHSHTLSKHYFNTIMKESKRRSTDKGIILRIS